MTQSDRRRARRECNRRGHVPKTDGEGHRWCARCGADLEET